MQRFQRVLSEVGIEVEVNEDGEGVEVTSNLNTTRRDSIATRNGAVAALGPHSRRGSFDSFFGGTADKVAGTDYGDLPLRTRRDSNGRGPNGHAERWDYRRATSDTEAQSYQHAKLPVRNRIKGSGHQRSTSGQQRPAYRRNMSVSSHGSLQIRRDGRTGTSRVGDYDADDSDHTDRTTSLDLSHVQVPGINAPFPDHEHESPPEHPQYLPEPFRPSDTRLLDDAERFEEQRLHRVTRGCIQTWRERTQERMSIHNDMAQLATAFDRRILLRLSFEQLRDTLRIRRSNWETERFFGRLEERADKARAIFLLTKAFTHWAKSAEDEVQRTSVARRHILRTRFFNGWREITAVNELKIQHFVLAKFLRLWRTRATTIRHDENYAIALYEENLVRRVYKDWFFKFCAIAAPAWRNDRTRRVTLQKMSEIAKVLRERQEWAVDRYERGLVRQAFQHWRHETATLRELAPQADGFLRRSQLSSAFRTMQKQAQLAPLCRLLQQGVDGRIVRTAFQTWRHTAQLSRQAREVDQMRILRNAWTAWNDRLRVKALQDRINDRIVVECLYKWTLASRVSLFQRVHNRQLQEATFLTWVTKTNQRSNTLDAAERRFAQFKRAQSLRTCLRKMEVITAERRAEEFAVIAQYQQKLKQRIFEKLKERQENFLQLNKWAGDASFYVLSKRTLRIWSEATQHARRNRRRDTYTQFRRSVKTNVVRRLFANWRDKANHVAHLNQQADDVLENRTMQTSATLLYQWRYHTMSLRQQDAQATNMYAFKLQIHTFQTWVDRMSHLQTLDSQAVALRQESTELAATSALKKLGWRLWNIQRQEETARALYERNFEKHVRAMVRFWAEQMNERLAERPVSPTPTTPRSKRSRRDDDDDSGSHGDGGGGGVSERNNEGEAHANQQGDETNRLEPWTTFDASTLGLNNDLDLSLSLTPVQQSTTPYAVPPFQSSTRPLPQRSILRPTPARPSTFPQPQSILRNRAVQQTIPEDSILDPAFATDLDRDLADPATFWSGTPLPPAPHPTTASQTFGVSAMGKPGYLKTPSKRSVARAKRPELPASPEKRDRVMSPERRVLGAMSAPPAQRAVGEFEGIGGGVTSFEKKLREGGFSGAGGLRRTVAGPSARGRGTGKAKVGFGDVSEMG